MRCARLQQPTPLRRTGTSKQRFQTQQRQRPAPWQAQQAPCNAVGCTQLAILLHRQQPLQR
ncbi:hypothetical protein NMB32_01750 [Stenotrophomonas sp. CD2]|nr:hypothetical protein NMB32_01750 [Stenotrophomonas sp. CD2]